MPATNKFDPICYLARYPDLRGNKDASGDPLKHWNKFGLSEGRVPGCDIPGTLYSTVFNGTAYLARYPDIRQSAKFKNDPFSHWQIFGANENRHPGFELIIPGVTPPLSAGVTSPGTVQIQDSNANNSVENQVIKDIDINAALNDVNAGLHPGDNTETAVTSSIVPPVTPNSNILLYVAGGAALLLILSHKKKKSSRKKRK